MTSIATFPRRTRVRSVLTAAVALGALLSVGAALSMIGGTPARTGAGMPEPVPVAGGPALGVAGSPTRAGGATGQLGAMSGAPAPPEAIGAPNGTGAGAAVPTKSPAIASVDLVSPKVIQNAAVTLRVGRAPLADVAARLSSLAAAEGGFVAESDLDTGAGPAAAHDVLRVPQVAYASTLNQVRALGRITAFSSSAQDVTGQYVDLQDRIAALRSSQAQYQTIMSRASTVGEILAVQSQLDGLDSQLEQLEGQAGLLSSETSYATIAVTALGPGAQVVPPPRPASGLAGAWARATAGFGAGMDHLVAASGPAAFLLLLLAALYGGWRLVQTLWTRRRRGRSVLPAG